MVVLYGFTVPLEDMRRAHKELDGTLVDIIKQILNQTAECLLFIQEYSGKGFAGSPMLNNLNIGQHHLTVCRSVGRAHFLPHGCAHQDFQRSFRCSRQFLGYRIKRQ